MRMLNSRKLSGIAAISVILMGSMFGCTKQTELQVVTAINARIPEVTAAADTVAAVIASLDPAIAIIVNPADVAFDAVAKTLQALCASYIANPNATTLQQIQTAINSLEQTVNASILSSVGIKDAATEELVLAALKGLLTVVTIVFAIIQPTETTAMLQPFRDSKSVTRMRPYIDNAELASAAAQYGITPDQFFAYEQSQGF